MLLVLTMNGVRRRHLGQLLPVGYKPIMRPSSFKENPERALLPSSATQGYEKLAGNDLKENSHQHLTTLALCPWI